MTAKVVLCTDGIHPHALGGMQRHSRLLAEHLARSAEIELTVIHPHAQQVFELTLGIREVHVPPIDTRRFYFRELWRYSARVARELDRLRPDAIISQGFCVWKDIDRFGARSIVHPHGLEMFQMLNVKERLLGWPFRRALRHIVRHSAVVISLGGKLTNILEEQVRGTQCRIEVIPNAVDVPDAVFTAQQMDTGRSTPLRLLFVGRFAFNKGIDVLMSVARRLAQEGRPERVQFQLAGDGPLLKRIEEDGLPPNVQLMGRVDDQRLAALYRECDVLVLPTRFEGMPTVVLEAMARSKPIIVSDVGATAELVDFHNGYLLPPGDADKLYHAVRSFAERTRADHHHMGLVSHERVKERFSWPLVSRRTLEVIQSVAARP